MMSLLLDRHYKSLCFVFISRSLSQTLFANKVLAQSLYMYSSLPMDVLSVFNERIS